MFPDDWRTTTVNRRQRFGDPGELREPRGEATCSLVRLVDILDRPNAADWHLSE